MTYGCLWGQFSIMAINVRVLQKQCFPENTVTKGDSVSFSAETLHALPSSELWEYEVSLKAEQSQCEWLRLDAVLVKVSSAPENGWCWNQRPDGEAETKSYGASTY